MNSYIRTSHLRNAQKINLLPLILLVAFLFSFSANDLRGQRKSRRNQRPKIGDIILFENAGRFQGEYYGLVINANRRGQMDVEFFDDKGEIDSIVVSLDGGVVWELVDRFEKKSELPIRTWKSTDGKFEFKAKMLHLEDDKVRLEKADGKSIAVSVKRLSQKDRDYIERNKDAGGGGDSNPFAVEESDSLPREVVDLMERRNELLQRDSRHQRLAKLFPSLALGDIIEFEDDYQDKQRTYGIVVKLSFPIVVEKVDEFGELEEARRFSSHRGWNFFDRQFVAIPMMPRKWSSASGTYDVTATLLRVDGEDVVLKKDDGSEVSLNLSKLSKTDQSHVKRVRARINVSNDPQLVEARKDYNQDLQILLQRRVEVLKDASQNYEVARDARKMKGISLRTAPFKLAGGTESQSFPGKAFVLNFPLRVPLHARIENVCYAKEGGVVAFVASTVFFGKPTLAVIDVETQDIVTNIDDDVGSDGQILAISPSGETLLVGSRQVFDRQVELWKHQDGRLRKLGTIDFNTFWAPQAHLFSDEQGVIQSSYGNLSFFDITDRIKPTHQMSVGGFGGSRGYQVAGSDQQAVFILSEDASKLYAIDGKTKRCLGGIKFNRRKSNAPFNFAQVTSDGRSVVYVESSRTSVYSLETGKKTSGHDFKGEVTPFKSRNDRFQYLGSNLVMNADGAIYEIEMGLQIGEVEGKFEFNAQYYPDGTRIIADIDRIMKQSFKTIGRSGRGDREQYVEAVNAMRENSDYKVVQTEIRVERLPVEEIVEFVENIKDSDIVEFGEGDSVEVIVDIDGNRGSERELVSYAKDMMAEGDINVVRGSDFTLELSYIIGARQNEKFRVVGYKADRIRNESIVPKTCKAELKYRGETIWKKVKSANLNTVGSEEGLNRVIKLANEMTADDLFEFELPTSVRVMIPGRRGKFSWE